MWWNPSRIFAQAHHGTGPGQTQTIKCRSRATTVRGAYRVARVSESRRGFHSTKLMRSLRECYHTRWAPSHAETSSVKSYQTSHQNSSRQRIGCEGSRSLQQLRTWELDQYWWTLRLCLNAQICLQVHLVNERMRLKDDGKPSKGRKASVSQQLFRQRSHHEVDARPSHLKGSLIQWGLCLCLVA